MLALNRIAAHPTGESLAYVRDKRVTPAFRVTVDI